MRIRIPVLVACVVVLLLVGARPAFAQDEVKGDFAFSYSVLHDSGFQRTLPAGYVLAVGADIKKSWRFVAEFGGNYKVVSFPGAGNVRISVLGYLGGLRFAPEVKMKARPYVQFLAGGGRETQHLIGTNGTAAINGVSVQPGFGFDFKLTKMLDGRAQLDYRAFRTGGVTVNDYRVAFGVVFPFGRN